MDELDILHGVTLREAVGDGQAPYVGVLGIPRRPRSFFTRPKGRPFVDVIGPEQYERLRKEEDEDRAILDRLPQRNAYKDPAEVETDVTAAVEAVRQEVYE